jgi:hypothetical protein
MTTGKGNGKDRVRFALPALGIVWLLLAGLIVIVQLGRVPRIEITWLTETEFDTAGFNVWRSDSPQGEYQKLNDQLIPGAPDASAGAEYRFVDDQVESGKVYYYKLEDVAYDNSLVQHETISASAQGASRIALGMAFACALIGSVLIFSSAIGRTQENEAS